MMGSNNKIILNNDNVVDVKESNNIADYDYIDVHDKSGLTVTSNSSKTYILPVKTENNLYLFNSYLLIEINNEIYYISNFNYINSNDILRIEKYLERGIIYEF